MKTSSKVLLLVAAVLAVALGLFFSLRRPGPSDQEQILAQLESARAAAASKNIGGILAIVSPDYKDTYIANTDQLHAWLIQAMRSSRGPIDVTLTPPSVTVQGDTATTTSHVTVRGQGANSIQFDRDVTLHWRREEAHRWLIFPTRVWRVVGADYGETLPGLE